MYNKNKLENLGGIIENIHHEVFKIDKLFGLEFDFDKIPDNALIDIVDGLGCGQVFVSKQEYIEFVEDIINKLKTNKHE